MIHLTHEICQKQPILLHYKINQIRFSFSMWNQEDIVFITAGMHLLKTKKAMRQTLVAEEAVFRDWSQPVLT